MTDFDSWQKVEKKNNHVATRVKWQLSDSEEHFVLVLSHFE